MTSDERDRLELDATMRDSKGFLNVAANAEHVLELLRENQQMRHIIGELAGKGDLWACIQHAKKFLQMPYDGSIDDPESLCNAVCANDMSLTCELLKGHSGFHIDSDGTEWRDE